MAGSEVYNSGKIKGLGKYQPTEITIMRTNNPSFRLRPFYQLDILFTLPVFFFDIFHIEANFP